MATINKDNSIIFTSDEIQAAWDNAPILENKESDEYRMCYICKFHMSKKDFLSEKPEISNWCIDFINVKKFSLEIPNLIAIHSNCIENRIKDDSTKILKKIKNMKWMYNEEFYNNQQGE